MISEIIWTDLILNKYLDDFGWIVKINMSLITTV